MLSRYPVCVMCHGSGRITPATVADHIKPLRQGGGWGLDNGQGLCHACHNAKTAKERGR